MESKFTYSKHLIVSPNAENEVRSIVLESHLRGDLSMKEAAYELGVSLRQFCRLKKRFVQGGVENLSHKNKGRVAWNKLPQNTVSELQSLVCDRYKSLSLAETWRILRSEHNINISYSTLRRIKVRATSECS